MVSWHNNDGTSEMTPCRKFSSTYLELLAVKVRVIEAMSFILSLFLLHDYAHSMSIQQEKTHF